MKVSDEILDAGREMFRRNPTLDLGTRLDLAYEAVALAERERLSSGAPSTDEVERLKRAVNSRLNDHLCDMKPNWGDSITGFNDAWDIVRAAFAEEMLALLKRSRVYIESHARTFGIDSDKQLVADIDSILAKASEKAQC